jgi:tRNA dimethylallyltransferase
MKPVLIIIAGPTGVGKTTFSIQWAKQLECPIISADSRQFYRELSIGTAKPFKEEINGVPHYFIDFRSIHSPLFVDEYEKLALQTLKKLFTHYPYVILTGGSGLYIKSICEGFDHELPNKNIELRKKLKEKYETEGLDSLRKILKKLDPVTYENIDLHNFIRIQRAIEICLLSGKKASEIRKGRKKKRPFHIIKFALYRERNDLYERIHQRVDSMIEKGLEEECKNLFIFRHYQVLNSVGYKEFFDFFEGKHSYLDTIKLIKRNSRHYAKRQLTWFKKDKDFKWIHPDNKEIQNVHQLLKHFSIDYNSH